MICELGGCRTAPGYTGSVNNQKCKEEGPWQAGGFSKDMDKAMGGYQISMSTLSMYIRRRKACGILCFDYYCMRVIMVLYQ